MVTWVVTLFWSPVVVVYQTVFKMIFLKLDLQTTADILPEMITNKQEYCPDQFSRTKKFDNINNNINKMQQLGLTTPISVIITHFLLEQSVNMFTVLGYG